MNISRDREPILVEEVQPGDLIAVPLSQQDRYGSAERWLVVSARVLDRHDWSEEDTTRHDEATQAGQMIDLIGPSTPTILEVMPPDGQGEPEELLFGCRLGGWTVHLLADHHPVCAQCGELWPCRHVHAAREARRFAGRMRMTCVCCGKQVASRYGQVVTQTPHGPVAALYCTRKGTRCRRAYIRAIGNDEKALAELRAEDVNWAKNGGAQ